LPHALHEAVRRFYQCYQQKHVTTQAYLEQFQTAVDVIDHCKKGSIGRHPGVLNQLLQEEGTVRADLSDNETTLFKKEAKDRYLAVAFILGAARYGRLIEGLENDYLQGQDKYPKTGTETYNVLINWKQARTRYMGPANDGVTFCHETGDTEFDGDGVALNNNSVVHRD
jgi:hypothetical protein